MSSSDTITQHQVINNPTVKLQIIPEEVDGSEHHNTSTIDDNGSSYRILSSESPVGIESLPEQHFNLIVRNGFAFNIMVLGETGVGKSTLIDSLFNIKFPDISSQTHEPNVEVLYHNYELHERKIKLKLGLIESRGFGDQINKTDSYKPIIDYIDSQFEKYLYEELRVQRTHNFDDPRVHVCLYLISPNGHGLRALDLVTMIELSSKTNLIPIIAKSDTVTKPELKKLKVKIRSEIKTNGINIYQFPVDDPEVAELNSKNNALLPFAIVGSHDFIKVGPKQVRARQYPWGTVQVENEKHCDFVQLRDMILCINLENLRETTHSKHYEVYRQLALEQMAFNDYRDIPKTSSFQNQQKLYRLEEQERRETYIKQMFMNRVKEKEMELMEAEKELHRKCDHFNTVNTQEKKRLEQYRKHLEEEIMAFEAKKASVLGLSDSSAKLDSITGTTAM